MRNLYSLAAVAALLATPMAAPAVTEPSVGPRFKHCGGYTRPRPATGKGKPGRHGQKLKSCRLKVGKRVRRKHRRAA